MLNPDRELSGPKTLGDPPFPTAIRGSAHVRPLAAIRDGFHGSLGTLAMACLLLSCACSQQDFDRNFQCHLLDEPRCARFREAFWNEGRKYASAASGSFVLAMQRVRNEAEAAGCDGRAAGNAAQAASPTRPSRPSRSSAAYRWKEFIGPVGAFRPAAARGNAPRGNSPAARALADQWPAGLAS